MHVMFPEHSTITQQISYSLPSTKNEAVLSMSDVETREELYKVDEVSFESAPSSGQSTVIMKNGGRKETRYNVAHDKDFDQKRKKKKHPSPANVGSYMYDEKHEVAPFHGVQKEKALENGHLRKDRSRHYRIGIYMYTKKRSKTF